MYLELKLLKQIMIFKYLTLRLQLILVSKNLIKVIIYGLQLAPYKIYLLTQQISLMVVLLNIRLVAQFVVIKLR
jgi:hypothetical protein